MTRYVDATTMAAGMVLTLGCSNNDVPEHEPTLVTITGDDGDGVSGDGPNNGLDETSGGEGELQCYPNIQPANPALFQCFGEGAGLLAWEEFDGSWTPNDEPVTIEFPSGDPTAPNVQACCKADADEIGIGVGCVDDCARAACNLALTRLQDRLSAGPPPLCNGACADRFAQTLTTWHEYIEANYESCLQVGRSETGVFNFPDPPAANDLVPFGAGRQGVLTIDCSVDQLEIPVDTGLTCDTSLNDPVSAAWEEWSCPTLEGTAVLEGPDGTARTPLTGSVRLRRGICDSTPCWFSIDDLRLEAAAVSQSGYAGQDIRASLAYEGFGLLDGDGEDSTIGTIATSMLGLDVTMNAQTPSTTWVPLSFPIANSDTVLLDVAAGHFQLIDAWFSWADHALTITTAPASCTCTSCP